MLPDSSANNIYSPGSDKLNEVQDLSASFQPGSWLKPPNQKIKKDFQRQRRPGLAAGQV